jgi:hypothetical protein
MEKAGTGFHRAENKNYHADLLPPIYRSADKTAQEKQINIFWYISHPGTIMIFKYAHSKKGRIYCHKYQIFQIIMRIKKRITIYIKKSNYL